MISFLKGQLIVKNVSEVTILTPGGVGYSVRVKETGFDSWRVGQEVELQTYLAVRENAMDLFGFTDENEKNLFLKFLDVSGIGPKTALHLLSLGTVEDISSAIGREDVGYLTKVSGIGRKTAERIVVELKNKVESLKLKVESGGTALSNNLSDVVEGLVAMGYTAQQAREAMKLIDPAGKTSEQMLKEALQRVK